MPDGKKLVDGEYLLKKFPGKGGWTYAEIPEVKQNKSNPFGWVQVRGSIDTYEFSQYKLMPMGNGRLFLPIRATIRKTLGKEAGSFVHVVLYDDTSETEVPQEILDCFSLEQESLYKTFCRFTNGERKAYLDWIHKARNENARADRIAQMMSRLEKGLKFYDTEK